MICETQRDFINYLVQDARGDFRKACLGTGVPQRVAEPWFDDEAFKVELWRAKSRVAILSGADPFAVVRDLVEIALFNPDEIFYQTENGLPAIRKWDDIPKSAKTAIKSVKVRTVQKGNIVEPVFEHITELQFHDKAKALIKLADLFGVESMQAFKADVEAVVKSKEKRGVVLRPPASRTFKHELSAVANPELTEEEEIERLLADE